MPHPGDVGDLGADCQWTPEALISADAYLTTADRDAAVAEILAAGAWTPPQVLVGPRWTVSAFIGDGNGVTPAEMRAVLTAVARKIGGTIRHG